MKDKYFGYKPEKMAYAREFVSGGLLSRKNEELIEAFNFIFDRNEKKQKCTTCQRDKYIKIIRNYWEGGQKVYKSYGMNLDDELAKIASKAITTDEIDEILGETKKVAEIESDDEIDEGILYHKDDEELVIKPNSFKNEKGKGK